MSRWVFTPGELYERIPGSGEGIPGGDAQSPRAGKVRLFLVKVLPVLSVYPRSYLPVLKDVVIDTVTQSTINRMLSGSRPSA